MSGNVNFNVPKDTTTNVRASLVFKEVAKAGIAAGASAALNSIFGAKTDSTMFKAKTGDGFEYSGKVDVPDATHYSGNIEGTITTTHTDYENGVVIGEHDVEVPYSGTADIPKEK